MNHVSDSIAENVRECQKCELCETRIKAVPGKGNFDADVIFVERHQVEMKTFMESHLYEAAGKRLDMILEDTGIDRKMSILRIL